MPLNKWPENPRAFLQNRHRPSGWPSTADVKNILSLHVTASGFTEVIRICYVMVKYFWLRQELKEWHLGSISAFSWFSIRIQTIHHRKVRAENTASCFQEHDKDWLLCFGDPYLYLCHAMPPNARLNDILMQLHIVTLYFVMSQVPLGSAQVDPKETSPNYSLRTLFPSRENSFLLVPGAALFQ